jgi:hypothetical protein
MAFRVTHYKDNYVVSRFCVARVPEQQLCINSNGHKAQPINTQPLPEFPVYLYLQIYSQYEICSGFQLFLLTSVEGSFPSNIPAIGNILVKA